MRETGRSMVETLGVMAIVGVLTIVGIAGYRFAINSYRANDIVHAVSLRYNDTKSQYQFKPLPTDVELNEWVKYTDAGYLIGIYPISTDKFEIRVSDVEMGTCKRVLKILEETEDYFIYTQVAGTQYFYNTEGESICTIAEPMQMVFFAGTQPVNGQMCLSNNNCTPCALCTDNVCTPKECEGNLIEHPDGKSCSCCPKGYALHPNTLECVAIPDACEDNQFRAQNGLCVDCDDAGNYVISSEPYAFPELGVADVFSGEDMCRKCTGRKLPVQSGGKLYCPYNCVEGLTYQALDGSCVSCEDTGINRIANDSVSKKLCNACTAPQHYVWNGIEHAQPFCGLYKCAEGEFLAHGTCVPCDEYRDEYVRISSGFTTTPVSFSKPTEQCTSCPNTPEQARHLSETAEFSKGQVNLCYPTCPQPEAGTEADTICRTDPTNEKCQRQWQNGNGKCFSCGEETTSSSLYGPYNFIGDREALCEACGREMNDAGYCVLKNPKPCKRGEFRGYNGACYSCGKSAVRIESEEVSGCLSNCTQNDKNEYVENGTVQRKWVDDSREDGKIYCYTKCGTNRFQDTSNNCWDCTNSNSLGVEGSPALQEICLACKDKDGNQNREINKSGSCILSTCPDTTDGVKQFHFGQDSSCKRCDTKGYIWQAPSTTFENHQECWDCGTRFLIMHSNNYYCTLFEPGVSGVCNSVENTKPDKMSDDLWQTAQTYFDGANDKIQFRDVYGMCQSCTDTNTHASSVAQCKSCGNRRYQNGSCIFGQCTLESQFLDNNYTCVDCVSTTLRTAIDDDEKSVKYCTSCEKRRTMVVAEQSYCTHQCEPDYFQDATGKCQQCTRTGRYEIGSDDTSKRLCENCGKTPSFEEDSEGVVRWYCK